MHSGFEKMVGMPLYYGLLSEWKRQIVGNAYLHAGQQQKQHSGVEHRYGKYLPQLRQTRIQV